MDHRMGQSLTMAPLAPGPEFYLFILKRGLQWLLTNLGIPPQT